MSEPDDTIPPLKIYDELVQKYRVTDSEFDVDEPAGRHRLRPQDVPSSLVPTPYPRRVFEHDDGSVYQRVPSSMLPSGDEIDSTTVVDDGAPA